MAVPAPRGVPEGRAVELPGRGETFIREAAGPPGAPTLVLLHGLSATGGLNWVWCFQQLATRYRVIAIDHRGHGRGIRTRQFRLADCADDVAALADVLAIPRLIAVGYSMGGPVAQLLWHRHRSLVEGLVLCATSRNFRGRPQEQAMYSILPFFAAAARTSPRPARQAVMNRMIERRIAGLPARDWILDELHGNDPASVAQAMAALGRFSSHEWIGDVDVPTAVVITEHDRLVKPHRQHKLAAAIPGATVHPVPGDHGVCVARPDLFVPTLMFACGTVTARAPRPV